MAMPSSAMNNEFLEPVEERLPPRPSAEVQMDKNINTVTIGDLVSPPLHCPLAHIERVYLSSDNVVRVLSKELA